MEIPGINLPLIVMLTGGLIVLNMLVKLAADRTGLPALVGYLLVGFLLRVVDQQVEFLSSDGEEILMFLATIGLTTLLFRIGLESNLAGLIRQLPRASLIGIFNLAGGGLAGFGAAYYLLGLTWQSSLVVGIALCATSVGISVASWQDSGQLETPKGELLLDVAELDDILAVLLMALLFVVLPQIQQEQNGPVAMLVLKTALFFAAKLLAFGLICVLFSRFAEKPLTHFLVAREGPPDPMLAVVGIGFIFAALAGMLGFSIAIGAFLAGLVFSRDPEAIRMEASFQPVYELFSPFFFIGIGLDVDPGVLGNALWPGLVLLMAAILGKLAANGIPVLIFEGGTAAALISVSMIPRAEIAMVVMSRARSMGEEVVSATIYNAVVIVCAATCLLAPLVVRRMLIRWPPSENP